MAAIARKASFLVVLSLLAMAREPEGQELYRQASHIATALSAGNPSDALTPIEKTFSGYEQLRDYFTGLTNAYQVNSELQMLDEKIEGDAATLTVHWALTLGDPAAVAGERREEDVTLHFVSKKGKWRIGDLSPIALFDPEPRAPQRRAHNSK